jgi:hypothetical protein
MSQFKDNYYPSEDAVLDFENHLSTNMKELNEIIMSGDHPLSVKDADTAASLLHYYDVHGDLTKKQKWLACKLFVMAGGEI